MDKITEIKLSNISKEYGSKTKQNKALDNINFTLKSGEIIGLLGPNGAGKTTLLKILATILPYTNGSIDVNNTEIGSMAEPELLNYKKQLGYLPEIPFIYQNLSAVEYLQFIGEIYEIKPTLLKERINYYLNLFELKEVSKNFLKSYSQGMLKKISLIAALINNQNVLLLDEPTNSFDPKTIKILKDILVEQKQKGKIIILSTHILNIAEQLSDRIIIINKGRLIYDKINSNETETKYEKADSKLEDIYFSIVN